MTSAAAAGAGWDGTWHGGFDNDGNGGGDGVQVIVTGGQVLGFYYHGDYLDTDMGAAATDGSITFHWDGGEGTLSNTAGAPHLLIHEKGERDRGIDVQRDE